MINFGSASGDNAAVNPLESTTSVPAENVQLVGAGIENANRIDPAREQLAINTYTIALRYKFNRIPRIEERTEKLRDKLLMALIEKMRDLLLQRFGTVIAPADVVEEVTNELIEAASQVLQVARDGKAA